MGKKVLKGDPLCKCHNNDARVDPQPPSKGREVLRRLRRDSLIKKDPLAGKRWSSGERVQNSHRAPTREKAPERGWCLPIGSIEGGSGHPELSWEDVREREPRRCLRQEVVILMLGLAINPNTCPENIMGGPIIAKVPKVVNEKGQPSGN